MPTLALTDEHDTARLATALEAALPARAVVVLSGTLGAGKTRFVQAFAEAAEIDRHTVTSPTFVLCQHHEGRRLIHHIDAYRMNSVDEFIAIGGLELMQDEAVTLIEWGERIAAVLPEQRIEVRIDVDGANSRRVTLSAVGSEFQEAVNTTARVFSRSSDADGL